MNEQKDSTSFFLDILSSIKEQVFHQKQQMICLTDQIIHDKNSIYISQALSHLSVGEYSLQYLDSDIRKLLIIFRIIAAEEKLPGSRILFLEQVNTFEDLIEKYIYITFLLRRIEFSLSKEAKKEAEEILASGQISVCAIKEITESEIFNDSQYVFNQAIQIVGGNIK